mgnify:CR=1 FL=1
MSGLELPPPVAGTAVAVDFTRAELWDLVAAFNQDPSDDALRAEIAREAHEVAAPRELRKNKELGREDSRGQLDDALDFDGEVQRGLVLGKVRMREIEAELEKVDMSTKDGRDREAALMEEFGRLSVQRINSARTSGENLGSGQREVDPFGQVHQAAGYDARRDRYISDTNGENAEVAEVEMSYAFKLLLDEIKSDRKSVV